MPSSALSWPYKRVRVGSGDLERNENVNSKKEELWYNLHVSNEQWEKVRRRFSLCPHIRKSYHDLFHRANACEPVNPQDSQACTTDAWYIQEESR